MIMRSLHFALSWLMLAQRVVRIPYEAGAVARMDAPACLVLVALLRAWEAGAPDLYARLCEYLSVCL